MFQVLSRLCGVSLQMLLNIRKLSNLLFFLFFTTTRRLSKTNFGFFRFFSYMQYVLVNNLMERNWITSAWLILAKKQCVQRSSQSERIHCFPTNQRPFVIWRTRIFPRLRRLHILHSSSDWLIALLGLLSSVSCENLVLVLLESLLYFPLVFFFTSARS